MFCVDLNKSIKDAWLNSISIESIKTAQKPEMNMCVWILASLSEIISLKRKKSKLFI